jgi:hypothetical protein
MQTIAWIANEHQKAQKVVDQSHLVMLSILSAILVIMISRKHINVLQIN